MSMAMDEEIKRWTARRKAGRDQRRQLLPVQVEVRRHGGVRPEEGQGAGGRERTAQADVCRAVSVAFQ
jgi:hypothetical protein